MDRNTHSLVGYLQQLSGSLRADPRTDADLLACFAVSRDETAFTVLVGRYASVVWENCRRVLGATPDAEDAFQATFLALAGSAASLRSDRLAGWLHRVSLRISRRSRASRVRRWRREAKCAAVPTAPAPGPVDECGPVWEEVENLPERLRLPLVLYYLDGKTQAEAGRALGVSDRAVSQRLDKALTTLRSRLERRGVAVTVAALGVALGRGAASAAAPSHEFVRRVAASAAAGRVSPGVAALAASGVAPGSGPWIALVLAVVGSVCGTAATLLWMLPPHQDPVRAEPRPLAPAAAPVAVRAARADRALGADLVRPEPWAVFTGRVTGADGRAVPQAKLAVLGRGWDQRGAGVRDQVFGDGLAGADGRFRLSLDREIPGETTHVWIAASAPRARTVVAVPVAGGVVPSEVVVRLAPGEVAGRVTCPKGLAVPGAVVRVVRFGGASFDVTRPEHAPLPAEFWPGPAVTGPDGRFVFGDIDPSTELKLVVAHPETGAAAMLDVPAHRAARRDVAVRMPAVRRFTGRVVAADTGAPVPGARLAIDFQPDPNGQPWVQPARTDETGAFSLTLPAAPRWVVEVGSLPLPYLGHRRVIELPDGDGDVTATIAVERGVVVRGTVADRDSGAPVPYARLRFFSRSEPRAADRRSAAALAGGGTDPAGRFAFAAPAGGGLLVATAPSTDYALVPVDPDRTRGRPYAAHAAADVGDGAVPEVAFRLERGRTVHGRVLLPDGSPVPGGWVWCSRLVGGRDSQTLFPVTIEDGRFAVPGCRPDRTYTVVLADRAMRYGAVAEVRCSDEPAAVTLRPCGSASVRVRAAPGWPFTGADLSVELGLPGDAAAGGEPSETLWTRLDAGRVVGADGHLALSGLVPGARYRVRASGAQAEVQVPPLGDNPHRATLLVPPR